MKKIKNKKKDYDLVLTVSRMNDWDLSHGKHIMTVQLDSKREQLLKRTLLAMHKEDYGGI